MITDPNRAKKNDPGNPEICNVFEFHKLYSDPAEVMNLREACRTAKIGCVACKQLMGKNLVSALAPVHEKRSYYETRGGLISDIISEGCLKAKQVAQQTMEAVRAAIKI
jgi:tryptophanyl-tRNA synthetase